MRRVCDEGGEQAQRARECLHDSELRHGESHRHRTGVGPGAAVRGVVDGHAVIVGREKLFRDRGLDIPAELAAPCAAWERAGHTVVLAGWDGQVRGAIAVADTIKPSAASVAADAGTDEVIAGALPAGKVAVIAGLQAQGRSVARHPERRNAAPVGDNPPGDGSQPEEQAASCLE